MFTELHSVTKGFLQNLRYQPSFIQSAKKNFLEPVFTEQGWLAKDFVNWRSTIYLFYMLTLADWGDDY